MAGMHAIILRRRHEERFRIFHTLFQIVIRRNLAQERAFNRISRIAILTHPRRARQQLVIAQHVEQRDLNHHRVPQFRTLRQRNAHQQPAVGSAHDTKPARSRNLARHQILRDRHKIIIDNLALGLQPRLMPGRSELAAATDIGQHIDPATFQPQFANCPGIAGRHRNLKPAIGIKQRRVRTIKLQTLFAQHEIRHLDAVRRRHFKLIDRKRRCIKARRQ